jgi:hypothetical protein
MPTERRLLKGIDLAKLLPFRQVLQNDTQLRTFLVKMTALQAKSLGSLGDMPTVPFELCEHGFPFESKYALRQRSRRRV